MTNTNQTAALAANLEAILSCALVNGEQPLISYATLKAAHAAIIAKHLPAPVSDGMVERLLTDGQRMLWRDDVEGICPTPDNCFEYGDRVRCGPCARRQAEACGIATYEGAPNLPEVARLKREVAQLEARIEKLTGALTRANQFAVTFIAFHNRDRNTERMGETLDGLLAEALVVDSLARAALNEKD